MATLRSASSSSTSASSSCSPPPPPPLGSVEQGIDFLRHFLDAQQDLVSLACHHLVPALRQPSVSSRFNNKKNILQAPVFSSLQLPPPSCLPKTLDNKKKIDNQPGPGIGVPAARALEIKKK
jgi:hypothetical protein